MEDLGVEKGGGMGFDISDESPDKILRLTTPVPMKIRLPRWIWPKMEASDPNFSG